MGKIEARKHVAQVMSMSICRSEEGRLDSMCPELHSETT